MPDNRSLPYGAPLPADFLEALQQFIGTGAYNFQLGLVSSSVVQVVAGTGNDQVGLGINGLWRYNTLPVNTAITGATGTYDICAVTGPNSFAGAPEVDSTNYAFTLAAPATGVPPTVPLGGAYRKVAEVDWDGTKITAVRSKFYPTAKRRTQTWALDATTTPVVGANQKVSGFPISLAAGETATLVGAYVKCLTPGATVFKLMYDHASHGTLVDVPGLTALTPATGGFVLTKATGGPLALAEGDEIAIVCVTVGSSMGVEISVVTEYTS